MPLDHLNKAADNDAASRFESEGLPYLLYRNLLREAAYGYANGMSSRQWAGLLRTPGGQEIVIRRIYDSIGENKAKRAEKDGAWLSPDSSLLLANVTEERESLPKEASKPIVVESHAYDDTW
jgi:hypothetical protein